MCDYNVVMPNMPAERTPITVRLAPEGLKAVDKIAADEDRSRSAVIRMLLKEAIQARHRQVAR